MKFKVYEYGLQTEKEVTEEKEWFIDTDGNLMFMTDDIDCPLHEAGREYYYKLEIEVL